MCLHRYLLVAALVLSMSAFAEQPQQSLILASTTSLENSGLYRYILPHFLKQTGIRVKVIPVGTGRALSIASRGDADVVIVHDERSELHFVIQGHGIERRTFMYNYYILVGPVEDPRKISATQNILLGFDRIAREQQLFVSRGDQSGTHKKELALWDIIGLQISPKTSWYKEVGGGMGATLNIANELGAYTITDTATWHSFKRRSHLAIIVADGSLLNPYSVILVNPQKHPGVNYPAAKVFLDWISQGAGAKLIDQFRFEKMKLFHLLAQQPGNS